MINNNDDITENTPNFISFKFQSLSFLAVSDAAENITDLKHLKLKILYSRYAPDAPRISTLLRNLVCYSLYN